MTTASRSLTTAPWEARSLAACFAELHHYLGRDLINMRSEHRRFPRGRCLVPVSHFYEFTGKRSPKDKWRFTKVGEDWFCIAWLWRPVEGDAAAFTMLTCEPGPDVAPIHNRQIVVLDRSEWAAWLNSQTA